MFSCFCRVLLLFNMSCRSASSESCLLRVFLFALCLLPSAEPGFIPAPSRLSYGAVWGFGGRRGFFRVRAFKEHHHDLKCAHFLLGWKKHTHFYHVP